LQQNFFYSFYFSSKLLQISACKGSTGFFSTRLHPEKDYISLKPFTAKGFSEHALKTAAIAGCSGIYK
jgi:hypothetical protein